MSRKKLKPGPLEEGTKERLQVHLLTFGPTKTAWANAIKLPRSTLSDILTGGNVSHKSMQKINKFIEYMDLITTEIEVKTPVIGGDELPLMSEETLQQLTQQFNYGVVIVIESLKRFVNADVGSRKVFHNTFRDEFKDLHTLVRAISSESVLLKVKSELGKNILP